MPTSDLSQKLRIGPGDKVLVLNPPPGYLDLMAPLPEGASASESRDGPQDQVQLFAADRAQLERELGGAVAWLKAGGVLWAAYPNPDSDTSTDLSRVHGWGSLQVAGLVAVAHIAVDGS